MARWSALSNVTVLALRLGPSRKLRTTTKNQHPQQTAKHDCYMGVPRCRGQHWRWPLESLPPIGFVMASGAGDGVQSSESSGPPRAFSARLTERTYLRVRFRLYSSSLLVCSVASASREANDLGFETGTLVAFLLKISACLVLFSGSGSKVTLHVFEPDRGLQRA